MIPVYYTLSICYDLRILNWDVMNENMHYHWYEDHTGNKAISQRLFEFVDKLDPDHQLFLNDYNVLNSGLYNYVCTLFIIIISMKQSLFITCT